MLEYLYRTTSGRINTANDDIPRFYPPRLFEAATGCFTRSLTRNRWIFTLISAGVKIFSSVKIAATNPTAYLLDYEISSVVDTVDSRAPVSSMTGTLLFSMRADIYLCSGRSVTKRKIYIYISKRRKSKM